MRKLDTIQHIASDVDFAIHGAIQKFNELRFVNNTVTFLDMQVLSIADAENNPGALVVLVYEYDDTPEQFDSGDGTYTTRYIGMRAGSDPTKPETWQRLDDITPVTSQEAPGATEDQDSSSGMSRSTFWRL